MYDEVSIGTSRQYKGILKKLKLFCGREKLYFDELNVAFIREYQRYMSEDLQNNPNTIHSNLKGIRKIINEAVAEELIPAEKNPFNKIKLKGQKAFRLFLIDAEIERLISLHLDEDTQMNHHRNMFVFSAFTGVFAYPICCLFDGDILFPNKKDKR